MSTDLDITLDPVQLVKDIFGSDENRNDLAVGIQNNTDKDLTIAYYIEHGSSRKIPSSKTVKPGEAWKAGVHAVGAGSNIGLSITMSNGAAYALMAATPVNKQNYFKISHNNNGYKTAKSAWNGADKHSKNYSDDGYVETEFNDHNMLVSITGASPAACTVEISEA